MVDCFPLSQITIKRKSGLRLLEVQLESCKGSTLCLLTVLNKQPQVSKLLNQIILNTVCQPPKPCCGVPSQVPSIIY